MLQEPSAAAGPLAERPPVAAEPTMTAALLDALGSHGGTALRVPTHAGYEPMAYTALRARVRAIARGLVAAGVAPGDRVAIMSRTRPEWTMADLGALVAGAVVVPIYETSSPEEATYVLEHSGATVLFAEGPDQLRAVPPAVAAALRHRVLFEDADPDALTLDELIALGHDVDDDALDARLRALTPGDPATIVYTSGTTGPPKGCVLTQDNLLADSDMVLERLPMDPGDEVFAFLPLAHVLTRMTQLVALRSGATIAYWRRDMTTVLDDLAEVRPTHLPSVPRVFEKAHARAHAAAEGGGRVKRAVFGVAVGVAQDVAAARSEGRTPPRRLRVAHRLADRVVLSKVRAVFGGRLKLALTGGAPIEPAIVRFFDACGVPVLEGYGMTETSAVSTLNTLDERRPGTVGRPLPECEVRIAEDGEVLVRGRHVFAGYHHEAEATAAALSPDGWLRTGDLGRVDPDGFLAITGRKKELIITSSGKNVSPANVENAIRQSPWLGQVVVVGDRRPFLVALVTLDAAEAPVLAAELGLGDRAPSELRLDPAVQAAVTDAVREANARFAPIEQVKRVAILPRELTVEAGELTPTLKVKRPQVVERYATTIERLYGDAPANGDLWLADRPGS